MEINATSDLLNDITKKNEELRHGTEQNAITQFINELVTSLAEKLLPRVALELVMIILEHPAMKKEK